MKASKGAVAAVLHAAAFLLPVAVEGKNPFSSSFPGRRSDGKIDADSSSVASATAGGGGQNERGEGGGGAAPARSLQDCAEPEAWHPQYSKPWSEGDCAFVVDCNSPSYDTQLECCKGEYRGQSTGYCLSTLPSPPTSSPTETGPLDVYYPDYRGQPSWAEGYCINTRPVPSGTPTYTSQLACCKGAYGGQVSGAFD